MLHVRKSNGGKQRFQHFSFGCIAETVVDKRWRTQSGQRFRHVPMVMHLTDCATARPRPDPAARTTVQPLETYVAGFKGVVERANKPIAQDQHLGAKELPGHSCNMYLNQLDSSGMLRWIALYCRAPKLS